MKLHRLLLMSGLSIERANSFSRQLRLLARAMQSHGVIPFLSGPIPEPGGDCPSQFPDEKQLSLGAGNLIEKTGAQAAVLIGYPDQFSFLGTTHRLSIPFFLWSQFSNVIDPELLKGIVCVPLTGKTASLLKKSGVEKIGPVIPHGVDCDFYRPLLKADRLGVKKKLELQNSFVIGTVGAHTQRKQLKRILETFSYLLAKRQDCVLVIKTDRTISHEGIDLEAEAERLGVRDSVRFITQELDEKRMNDLYNAFDLYVNLSEWEGFCIPVIEAMACGIPVASPPIQGPGEILPYRDLSIEKGTLEREGERSLFHADPRGAAELLLEASRRPVFLRELGERGRLEARNRYNIHHVVQLWIELVQSLW